MQRSAPPDAIGTPLQRQVGIAGRQQQHGNTEQTSPKALLQKAFDDNLKSGNRTGWQPTLTSLEQGLNQTIVTTKNPRSD